MDGRANNKIIITTKDIAFIAMCAAILFIQEELLTFIPNVQLTIFLLVLFSKKLGFFRTTIIVIIHVLLDNLVMGSLNLFYTPAMFIGWMFIPIVISCFCKNIENPILLGVFGCICAFLYCWTFIVPNVVLYKIDPVAYLLSDIIFELILAACGFITTAILYSPCSNLFDRLGITKTKKNI